MAAHHPTQPAQTPTWTAIAKSIRRNHPFFNGGYALYGYDWNTFHACYPLSAVILHRELFEGGSA